MFMGGVFAGAGLNLVDPNQERDPPAGPTPVTFPDQTVYQGTSTSDNSPLSELRPLLSKILKPSDISSRHLEALNIEIQSGCSPENLLPSTSDCSAYFPSLGPEKELPNHSYADATKADPNTARRRKDFDERVAELRIQNDVGFRIINRSIQNGVKAPRLGYMRKFWDGIESLSQYWDTSLDQYYEGSASAKMENPEASTKRQRLDSAQANGPSMMTLQTGGARSDKLQPQSPMAELLEGTRATFGLSKPETEIEKGQNDSSNTDEDRLVRSPGVTSEPQTCMRYKGRRTASGRDMPEQFRVETVRAFVEATVWPFTAVVAPPRHMPIVQVQNLNVPVRQTAAVYRPAKERHRQRQGYIQGPLYSIQVRSDTDFDSEHLNEQQKVMKSRLDLMREIGGLLQIAQERRRCGKTETRPGEGKWWTTKPRWGGGPGGEVGDSEEKEDKAVQDVLQMAEEMIGAPRNREQESSTRRPKRKTPAMLWKELKPGSKLWDTKTDYQPIGKDPHSEYDEIFMVSSLNHHISILKLTTHSAYLEYIQTETLPNPSKVDRNWCRPRLQRTQWYDLLDIDQRVAAFRALWGVTAYLLRDTDGAANAGAERSTHAMRQPSSLPAQQKMATKTGSADTRMGDA